MGTKEYAREDASAPPRGAVVLLADKSPSLDGWVKRGGGPAGWNAREDYVEIVPGKESTFEDAFSRAKEFIASMAGFRSLRLSRCVEQPNRYLLLVEWDRLEDHTEGFRGSPEYKQWRALLHHFYDPFPTVEHYQVVATA